MTEIAILITSGTLVGLISSFFGVGGGILAIPVMYHLYPEIPPIVVIASSLAMIFFSSINNSWHYIRAGQSAQTKLVALMSLGMISGALLGSIAATYLDPKILKLGFAVIVLVTALRLVLWKAKDTPDQDWSNPHTSIKFKLVFVTFWGGVTAGLTGLGGGAIMVPLFISLVHMPVKVVPLYSNLMMVAGTLVGIIKFGFFQPTSTFFVGKLMENGQLGAVNFFLSLSFFAGSLLTTKSGVKLNHKVDPTLAKRLFALLLFIVSIRLFIKVLV